MLSPLKKYQEVWVPHTASAASFKAGAKYSFPQGVPVTAVGQACSIRTPPPQKKQFHVFDGFSIKNDPK
jgi:uncharacterized lipoprotein